MGISFKWVKKLLSKRGLKTSRQRNENKIPTEETTVKKITNIKCSGLKGLENSTIQVASDAVIGRPQNQLFNWPLDSCSNFLCEQTSVSVTTEVQ